MWVAGSTGGSANTGDRIVSFNIGYFSGSENSIVCSTRGDHALPKFISLCASINAKFVFVKCKGTRRARRICCS